jgi:hypothetical protein
MRCVSHPSFLLLQSCFICGIVTTSGTDLGIVTTTLVQGFTSKGESLGFVASSGQLLHLGWWSTAMSCCYPRRGLHTPSTPTYLEQAREQQGTTVAGKGSSSSLSAAATTMQPSTHLPEPLVGIGWSDCSSAISYSSLMFAIVSLICRSGNCNMVNLFFL